MSRATSTILAGLMAVGGALAQADHASPGFKYVGCVEADPSSFGLNVDFFKPFTPDQCQRSCAGKATYAALGGGCHCDVPGSGPGVTFSTVDDSKCATPCIKENPAEGMCGGDGNGPKRLFTLYQKSEDDMDDGCEEEHGDADPINRVPVPAPQSTVIKTIISCAPEVTDCPSTPVPPPCPPEGCAPPPNTKVPAPVPCPEACLPCPPEGCPACADGQSCPPPCPPNCIPPPPPPAPPAPPAPTSAAPVCPPGGCPAPTPPPMSPNSTIASTPVVESSAVAPVSTTAAVVASGMKVGLRSMTSLIGAAAVVVAIALS